MKKIIFFKSLTYVFRMKRIYSFISEQETITELVTNEANIKISPFSRTENLIKRLVVEDDKDSDKKISNFLQQNERPIR